jgi:serine phosphatase RsbU (regulator of sigma subunit)
VRGVDVAALGMGACALADLVLALFVWSRRQGGAGRALTAVLLALMVWNLASAAELLSSPAHSIHWGDLKYVGIGALVPAWLAFVLCWTGHSRRVTPRLVALLVVEPVLLLALLAVPATHDLVRFLDPDDVRRGPPYFVSAGPLFWVHLAYLDVLMLGATAAFIVSMLRRSRAYGMQAAVLTGAALLPWVTNLGYNFGFAPLDIVDLTPVAFTVAAAVLAWGMFRQHLLRLAPVAYRQIVAGMSDAVLLLDMYGHLVETNPAGERLLNGGPTGRPAMLLPERLQPWASGAAAGEVSLEAEGVISDYEVQASELPDRHGRPKGRLLVLRDVTDRRRSEREVSALHAAQARIADTLSRSLRPDVLPAPAGVRLAAAYRPAGLGHEVGGDFYDVFPCGPAWGFAIGDVSGKGAPAAAVTALARYTLRALSSRDTGPRRSVAELNEHLLASGAEETYLTVAHGRFTAAVDKVTVRFVLGGHPHPMLVRADTGAVRAVGRAGTAVGLIADTSLHEATVTLGPGDALLFYTDGVTEARRGGEFFGEDGLIRVLHDAGGLPATGLTERVLAAVLDFQDQHAADDIALLVIQAPQVEAELRPRRSSELVAP